jgi:hypothetical protein
MHFSRLFYFLSVVIFISSCTTKEPVFETYELVQIPVLDQEMLDPEELFEGKEIIELEFCDDCIIAEVQKIMSDETGIYVLDKTIVKSLKKFDWNGNLIYSINESGSGLGKYVLPFDFDLVDEEVIILDVNQRKMLFFDSELGTFEKEERLGDFQAVSFATLGNQTFAYHLDGRTFGPGKHFLGLVSGPDSTSDSSNWVFDFGNSDNMTVEQEFSKGQEGVLFAKSMNDTIYSVDERGFSPKYYLNFGGKGLSDEIRDGDIMESRQKIMTEWPYFHWGRVFENSQKLFFLWSGDQGERNLSFFDKKLKKTFLLKGNDFFPNKIFHLDEARLLVYITPEEYMENDIKDLNKEYKNPVIVSYKFRANKE